MKKIFGLFIAVLFFTSLNAQSKLPVLVQKLLSQMVYVEGGKFMYESFQLDYTDKKGEEASVKGFYAAKYEVSRELFKYVMNEERESWNFRGEVDLTKPANAISWYDAVNFCNKVSEIAGFKKCYVINGTNVSFDETANGFRLPKDMEWEFLGRGGNHSKGGAYVGDTNFLDDVCTFGYYVEQSGLKKPNELGLYDLAGNVWEWCWDGDEKQRAVRGGSFATNARACYVSSKANAKPEILQDDIGFRVVRNK